MPTNATSPDVTAAIRGVFDEYASHINCAGPNCCPGCNIARQIPFLLDEVERLTAENKQLRNPLAATPINLHITPDPTNTREAGFAAGLQVGFQEGRRRG